MSRSLVTGKKANGLVEGTKQQDPHLEPKNASWLTRRRGEKLLFIRWEPYEMSSLLGCDHEGYLPPCLRSAASQRSWMGSTYRVSASLQTLVSPFSPHPVWDADEERSSCFPRRMLARGQLK